MSSKVNFRKLGRAFKLFVVGSFVATRTASGAADPDDSLRHELAWMAVRDGLADVVNTTPLPAEVRRIVEQEIDKSLDFRVAYTYRSISADEIAQLDTLWIDHLAGQGAASEEMDQFLEARTVALRQLVNGEADAIESPDQLRNVVREFSRGTYTG